MDRLADDGLTWVERAREQAPQRGPAAIRVASSGAAADCANQLSGSTLERAYQRSAGARNVAEPAGDYASDDEWLGRQRVRPRRQFEVGNRSARPCRRLVPRPVGRA